MPPQSTSQPLDTARRAIDGVCAAVRILRTIREMIDIGRSIVVALLAIAVLGGLSWGGWALYERYDRIAAAVNGGRAAIHGAAEAATNLGDKVRSVASETVADTKQSAARARDAVGERGHDVADTILNTAAGATAEAKEAAAKARDAVTDRGAAAIDGAKSATTSLIGRLRPGRATTATDRKDTAPDGGTEPASPADPSR